jgi:Tfp pilus assembly protein PilX
MKIRTGHRRHPRGVALPIVLLISSMLLVTAAAWLEAALVGARATGNLQDRVQAFHGADSALLRCARIALDSLPQPSNVTGPLGSEPDKWRLKASFEGASANALMPFTTWPQAAKPPQCLIEAWPASNRDGGGAFLITARGFGRRVVIEAWLQQQVEITESGAVARWRRVAAKPFQTSSP